MPHSSPLTPTLVQLPAYSRGGPGVAAVTQAMSQHYRMPSLTSGAYQPVTQAHGRSPELWCPSLMRFDQKSRVRCRCSISGIPEAAVSDLGDKVTRGLRPALGSPCGLAGGHGQILSRKMAASQSGWGGRIGEASARGVGVSARAPGMRAAASRGSGSRGLLGAGALHWGVGG